MSRTCAWSAVASITAPLALATCALALAVSCGDGGGTVEDTDAVTGSGTTAPDGYPAGPYGADVGEILPNLEWSGFVSDDPGQASGRLASAAPYGSYSLDEARRSGKRFALLHFGAVF